MTRTKNDLCKYSVEKENYVLYRYSQLDISLARAGRCGRNTRTRDATCACDGTPRSGSPDLGVSSSVK